MTTVAWEMVDTAVELMTEGPAMLLSGAGMSTESGIPDYRGSTGRARRATPMTYSEFVRSDSARRRYWARSHVGWRAIAQARPNPAHFAVAALQHAERLSGIVTQNVDGLHQRAGASSVVELHGNLSAVICLRCGERTSRTALDARLREANPDWEGALGITRPDGDATVADREIESFATVDCGPCGGLLKPDVVFFGESVPKARVQDCFALLESSALLIVVGSSLAVMSGYRFALRAAQQGTPILIINQGPTRADSEATLRVDARLSEALPDLVRRLSAAFGSTP